MNRFTYYSLLSIAYAAYTATMCISVAFPNLTHFVGFADRFWYIGVTVGFFLLWGLARSLAWLGEALWIQALIWIYAIYVLMFTYFFNRNPAYMHTLVFSTWARDACDLLPVAALLCVRTTAVKPYCTFYAASQLAAVIFAMGSGWWGVDRASAVTTFYLVLLIFRWLMSMILLFFFLRLVLLSREPDPLQEAVDRIGQAPAEADAAADT